MADILSFNLTETDAHAPRRMNAPDLSTKLKYVFAIFFISRIITHPPCSRLMGVDVASFGDYFADKRLSIKSQAATAALDKAAAAVKPLDPAQPLVAITMAAKGTVAPTPSPASVVSTKRGGRSANEPIKCLVYNDPFSSTYKKYIFTADGKYLLGGMMIGDVSDFVKLVAIVKKKVQFFFPFGDRRD